LDVQQRYIGLLALKGDGVYLSTDFWEKPGPLPPTVGLNPEIGFKNLLYLSRAGHSRQYGKWRNYTLHPNFWDKDLRPIFPNCLMDLLLPRTLNLSDNRLYAATRLPREFMASRYLGKNWLSFSDLWIISYYQDIYCH